MLSNRVQFRSVLCNTLPYCKVPVVHGAEAKSWYVCSEQFHIRNGTRQGSLLSPALFSVYIDDLIVDLRRLAIGDFNIVLIDSDYSKSKIMEYEQFYPSQRI